MAEHYVNYARFSATVFIISIGPFICGVALGFSSLVSAQLHIGDNLIAFFSSVINLGALVGCLIIGPILNTLGRRAGLLISSVPSIVGWLLIFAARDLSASPLVIKPLLLFYIILGRVLSGISAGMLNAVCSVYLIEVAPPQRSGRIGSLAQVATVAGSCFAYYCGMVAMWHQTSLLMVFASMVLFGATLFLAESPAWLAKRTQAPLRDRTRLGPEEKVEEHELPQFTSNTCNSFDCEETSLQRFHQNPSGKDEDITVQRNLKNQPIISLLPCLNLPPELRANFRLAILLMVAQQTTGINVITFYTQPLCQRIVSNSRSAFCAFALGLAQLLFSCIASFYIIDRLPRRRLIIATGALMATSMFFFAIGQEVLGTMRGLALVIFLLGFQCGWGPLSMLITTELFPPRHRGNVIGLVVATNWVAAFVVTQTFQPLAKAMGGSTGSEAIIFLFYSVATILSTMYLYFRLPETNKVFL